MTQEDYVQAHRYELAGLVLDFATVHRDGTQLAWQMRTVMQRVDELLRKAWRDAEAAHDHGHDPLFNGKPAPPPARK